MTSCNTNAPADLGTGLRNAKTTERLKGIAFLCSGALLFTLQDVVIKLLSGKYPLPEIMAFRCVAAVIPLLVLVHYDGGLSRLRIRHPWPLLARGLLLLGSYTTYYLALAAIPLAEAISLSYSAPLFIALLAVPILGEKPRASSWLAIIVGFIGVIIVSHPGAGVIDPAALLAVAGAAFYALAQLMARRLGIGERASIMAVMQNFVFFIAAIVMGAVAGRGGLAQVTHPSMQFLLRAWQTPDLRDLLLISSTGLVAAVASWLLTHAYRIAEAHVIAPFEYSSIPWATTWGILIWGEIPDGHTIVGIIVIIGTGIFVLWMGGRARRQVPKGSRHILSRFDPTNQP
jgi:drug/metabolite transporter (DMT)-like permease